jgi:hypothetical protein
MLLYNKIDILLLILLYVMFNMTSAREEIDSLIYTMRIKDVDTSMILVIMRKYHHDRSVFWVFINKIQQAIESLPKSSIYTDALLRYMSFMSELEKYLEQQCS